MKSIALVLMLAVPVMAQSIDKKSATEKPIPTCSPCGSWLVTYASKDTPKWVQVGEQQYYSTVHTSMAPLCQEEDPACHISTQADIQRLEKRIAELEKKLALVAIDDPKKPVMVDLARRRCYGRLKNSPEEFCWEVYPDGRNCTRHYDKSGKENGLTCVKAAK